MFIVFVLKLKVMLKLKLLYKTEVSQIKPKCSQCRYLEKCSEIRMKNKYPDTDSMLLYYGRLKWQENYD